MKCQRCGAEIPDDKIYCEKCGTAVQMVPDYNPAEDIAIGTEEVRDRGASAAGGNVRTVSRRRWRCGLAGVSLAILGLLCYRSAYQYVLPTEGTAAEPEEEVLPEVTPVLVERPQFDTQPGAYSYSPMLTILYGGNRQGEIHYTMDGTTPDEGSAVYRTPVSIGEGTTVVRAVFICDDGVQSEEASGTYYVSFQYPDEPVFSVPSGSYEGGISVTITAGEGCRIYYTTNGEEPGLHSMLYQGPVYIAPGHTVLQAVSVAEDGGSSAITEASYNVSEIIETPEEENTGIPAEEPAIP